MMADNSEGKTESDCVQMDLKQEGNINSLGSRPTKEVDITRYFDNAPRTIFDDIISNRREDAFQTTDNTVDGMSAITMSSIEPIPSEPFETCEMFNVKQKTLNDAHRDVWIPSEGTRKILRAIATSTVGTSSLDPNVLTMPGLAVQDDLPDLIKSASLHFLGEDENIHRNMLTAGDVTQDERGLRNLIQAGCYKAAVNLTVRLLTVYAQGYGKMNHPSKHSPHSLQLWYTRLALLTKLRQVDILENEAKAFGDLDKPDMYFAFYPELYGTRHGSMASFAFRLLLAEVPLYCGKPKQALDNLYKILATVNKIVTNFSNGLAGDGAQMKLSTEEQEDAIRLWKGRKSRVLISIVNCSVLAKNYVLAIEVLEMLYTSFDWTPEQLDALNSSLGRIYLLLGDVLQAKKLLVDKNTHNEAFAVRRLTDMGLMAVAQNNFQEAYKYFQSASTMDPGNIALINNMAVCLLYTGQLKEAVHLYENTITRNPVKSLQEPVLLNMCTSYELHTTHCKQTKLHLLRQLNRYKGDAIDVQCLKLVLQI